MDVDRQMRRESDSETDRHRECELVVVGSLCIFFSRGGEGGLGSYCLEDQKSELVQSLALESCLLIFESFFFRT